MKHLFLFLILFHYTIANAGFLGRGGDGGQFFEILRAQVPYSQLTKLGDKKYLLETGNHNVLKNADFQGSPVGDGWNVNTANLDNVAFDETMKFNGTGSFQVDLKVGNYTDLEILSQSYSATDYQLTGANLEFFIRIAKSILDPAVNLKWCFYADTVQKACVVISSTPASTSFQEFWSVVGAEVDASTVYKVALLATYNVPSGQVGVLNFSTAYLGPVRRVGMRVPPTQFTAQVAAAGTITRQTGSTWLSGCVYTSSTFMRCTYVTGFATQAPNCEVTVTDSGTSLQAPFKNETSTHVDVYFRKASDSTANNSSFSISCTKAGVDEAQAVVDQANGADLLGTHFYTGDAQCPINSVEGGSTISRTSYPALFAKWGTTYGAGDGSTTFGVAKTNGIYIRGMGSQTISSVTYTASTRGQLRTDAMQPITGGFNNLHGNGIVGLARSGASYSGAFYQGSSPGSWSMSGGNVTGYGLGFDSSLVTRTDSTTHGADIALRSCFWAVSNPFLPIAGSVTSTSPTGTWEEWAVFGGGGTAGSCNSSPCTVLEQSTPGLMSMTRSASGQYQLVHGMGAGTFCVGPGTAPDSTNGMSMVSVYGGTSTTWNVGAYKPYGTEGAFDIANIHMVCRKKK